MGKQTSPNGGWIKLYRKSTDSQVWQNPHLWHLWTFCLIRANHKDRNVELPTLKKRILVRRSQFLIGRVQLHKALYPKKKGHKPDARTVWRWLRTLEKMGNITKQTVSAKCSLITVPNYEMYQSEPKTALLIPDKKVSSSIAKSVQLNRQKCPAGSPCLDNSYERNQGDSVQQKAKKCPAESQKVSTNKKFLKEIYSPNSEEFRLSELLFSLLKERKENFRKPNLQKWAVHIDRLIRIDKRTPEQIERVIRWCQQDSFWQNNILSTERLRTQIDQLEFKMQAKGKADAYTPEPLVVLPSGQTPLEAHLAKVKGGTNGQ